MWKVDCYPLFPACVLVGCLGAKYPGKECYTPPIPPNKKVLHIVIFLQITQAIDIIWDCRKTLMVANLTWRTGTKFRIPRKHFCKNLPGMAETSGTNFHGPV